MWLANIAVVIAMAIGLNVLAVAALPVDRRITRGR
jgi:hypothetical protein